MKKIITLILGLSFVIASQAKALDSAEAENFIKQVTTQGIEEIINSNVSIKEKDARFEKLFNEYLDLDYIGKFVLGRYWKTATAKQREAFISVYREFNVKTWSKRFDEFKGKKFEFDGTTPSTSEGQIFVNTSVKMKEGAPAKVVWRVKDGKPLKIVDIIIENVSLAITARNEYTAYIKKAPNGVDDLIEDLRQKAK
ncbi:MAG: ABC transporter substrate-binding protein [Alphaproteobacteria bacterium]|nr:ABC transporter substrate-binding protein [Alphaproteobacteria bacterium]